jgi:hypothetical protein
MCDAPENTSIDDTHFWVCNCKKSNSPIGFQENIHIAYMSDECGRTSCVDDTGHGDFAM